MPLQHRTLRADRILRIAIIIVSILVTALLFQLGAENRLHGATVETILAARSARDEMQALTGSLAEVELARRAVLQREAGAGAQLEQAAANARERVARLRRLATEGDSEMLTAHIGDAVEKNLRLPASAASGAVAQTRTELRLAMDYLRHEFNLRNDAARERERRGRERLAQLAWGLALLSLAGSALALFVLRREREQWRLAHAAEATAHAAAAASDRAKTRFLASASHDMRQPLHALALYLNALRKRVQGDEARGILEKAERATQSMVGMFATLLDLARVQAGAITPDIADFPLQDIFDRIRGEHPGADVRAAPTNTWIRTDQVLLERLLRNLVANALKHGGRSATLEAEQVTGKVRIAVRDDGPGLAPEDQGRIFEEFVRLDTGKGGEGLGLGLAIVKRISDLLDLGIELRSNLGEGAVFQIHAPLGAARPSPTPQRAEIALNADAIVIDDDPLALEALAGALRDLGMRVRACSSERELEAALNTSPPPALLVTDLRLDGRLVGLDLANRLRPRLAPPQGVIVVTGDTAPETLNELKASGYSWLIKPIDPEELARAAADALGLRRI